MTALKHGLYRIGFMLCDRCTMNANCEQFKPDSACTVEKQAYERLVKELTKHYKLDMVADRILAERAAMYLIKISRVEAHEATSGVTQRSLFLGNYITRLDNTLRGFLNDLAVNRLKRKNLERTEQLMVNIEDILERLATRPMSTQRQRRTAGGDMYTDMPFMVVQNLPPNIIEHQNMLNEWRREMFTLRALIARKRR